MTCAFQESQERVKNLVGKVEDIRAAGSLQLAQRVEEVRRNMAREIEEVKKKWSKEEERMAKEHRVVVEQMKGAFHNDMASMEQVKD